MRNYILSLLLILSALPAGAATVDVTFGPQTSGPFAVGETFTLDIVASFYEDDAGTLINQLNGGSVSVAWNPGILLLDEVNVNTDITAFGSSDGAIDQVNGSVDTIGFATNINADNEFIIATLSFTAVGAGTSDLILTDPNSNLYVWSSTVNLDDVTPNFTNGTATVVPIPAAGYLMLSGLLLLASRRSRV